MGPELVRSLLLDTGAGFSLAQGFAFVALVLSIGILATARPLLTLVVVFGAPLWALLVGEDGMSSFAGLVLVGGLVWVEHHLRSTEWSEVFAGAFELQGVLGIGVAWVALLVGSTPRGPVFDLGAPLAAAGLLASLVAAVALHAVVYRARVRVWKLVRDLGLAGVGTLAETVLVAIMAGILHLAPFVAFGIAALAVVPLLVAAGIIQAGTVIVDAGRRAPCPACGRPARVEASRCPHCQSAIPVVRSLA